MMTGGGFGYTVDELICCCIARQVHDGDVLAQGLATPLVAAGYMLAQRTHAPAVYFASAIGQTICREGGPLTLTGIEDVWVGRAMNEVGFVQAAADLLVRLKAKEFFRPGQVDTAGRFNNVAIGADARRPRLRLPGAGGIPDVTVFLTEIYLYVPRHNRVTFVERVDIVSSLGGSGDGREARRSMYLVSDLGQFDFDGGRMRLTHLHPGVSMEHVRAKTGFALDVAAALEETAPPSADELRLLREDIDPLGVRRLETLSGAERREHLRSILAAERAGQPEAAA
jgi:acyl CoA:acetate/3-ketoacid CoA transferase beta subunit